jgi:hypothetical protein
MSAVTAIMEIKLCGQQGPDSVHVRDAMELLAGIEKAARALSLEADAGLALVEINTGSAKYALRKIALGAAAASMLTYALSSGDYDQLPSEARVGIREALVAVKRLDRTVEIRWNREDPLPAITIDSTTPVPSATSTSTCQTIVYGTIETVGGKTPGVVIRADGGAKFRVHTTTDQAMTLANRLYQPVRVAGVAEYKIEDLSVVSFEAAEIEPFERISFAAAMGELRGALADAWVDRSVQEMIADLRGDEGEDDA